jgi:hypothetical protein
MPTHPTERAEFGRRDAQRQDSIERVRGHVQRQDHLGLGFFVAGLCAALGQTAHRHEHHGRCRQGAHLSIGADSHLRAPQPPELWRLR